jgi:hypothetical protein
MLTKASSPVPLFPLLEGHSLTESTPTASSADGFAAHPATQPAPPAGQQLYAPLVPTAQYVPAPAGQFTHAGRVGKIRGTGVCILLMIITFGIYGLVWFYQVHSEMKRHSGQGVDGGIALLLAFFIGIVMPYITSSEVGGLYERRGQAKPVSGAAGLWYFPGAFILVGPLVWFIKTNGALNAYWRSVGGV